MRTVYTTLPIYDSTSKQDYSRTGQVRAIITPRQKLPPFQFQVSAGVAEISAIFITDCDGNNYDITSYFATLPALYDLTDNLDYIQYKGGALKTLLPYGIYYLKIVDDLGNYYYSEWISVEDVYPLLKNPMTWDDSYDSFAYSGLNIATAVCTSAAAVLWDRDLPSYDGDRINVSFFHTQNSGELPSVEFYDDNGSNCSEVKTVATGMNEFQFNISAPANRAIYMRFANTATASWEASNIWATHDYSDNYLRLKFSNTKDIPTQTNEPSILYQDDWFDQIWLKTKLNTPEHETVRIGNEKNGVFIAQKIISIFRYKIIDYIGRNLYRALHRLPLHDDVQITDEVGNIYDVGHDIKVDPISWNFYDMGTLTMMFNDGASYFEGNAEDLT